MEKYKQAALSIAFLTMVFTAGLSNGYIIKSASNGERTEEEAVLVTFENRDYEAYRKLVKKPVDNISENDFHKFVAARNAARNGDYDQAIDLAASLAEKLSDRIG